MNDAQLVLGVLAGKEECFTELVRRYQEPVLRWIRMRVKNDAIAEELCQQTLIIMCRKLWQFNPAHGEFRSWLLQIAKSQILMFLRRLKNKPQVLSLDLLPLECLPACDGPEVDCLTRARQDRMWDLICRLPARLRVPVVGYFYLEMSYAEIGRFLGKPESTIRSQIHLAAKLLHGWLAADGVRGPAEFAA